MEPDKTDALLELIEQDFPQTGPPRPRPISVTRDCEGPLFTYYVTIFRRGRFVLWVSEDCFQYDPEKIREAMDELEWITAFEKHDRLLLTTRDDSTPDNAKGVKWNGWHLCWDW